MTPMKQSRRVMMQGTALVALAAGTGPALAAPARSAATQKVLDHHLGAFAKGLDELMKDYNAQSSILSQGKAYHGVDEIRHFFDAFLKGVQPGFWEAFKISTRTIDRDVAYLVWEAKPFVNLATDTLVVRNGKVWVQTFTAT